MQETALAGQQRPQSPREPAWGGGPMVAAVVHRDLLCVGLEPQAALTCPASPWTLRFMASDGDRRDAKSLVSSLLGPDSSDAPDDTAAPELAGAGSDAGGVEPSRDGQIPGEPSDAGEEMAALIDVYFELEEPEERDTCFDQIVATDSPLVREFLRAVMEEDEDEYVRTAAAGELARRGDVSATATLVADLQEPDEPYFFEHAVQVLAEIGGPEFYELLSQIWMDPDRDADQRREAMLGMETADPERALAAFAGLLTAITDIVAMPDDQVEVAIAAFVRHAYAGAIEPLMALRDRIAATEMDEEERRELVGMLQEGIDLLQPE